MSKLSSAQAFGYAASGSMNEQVAAIYDKQFNNYYDNINPNLGGWLGDAVKTVKESHDLFMRSRLWELGNKLKGNDGMYVGRYEIGYLGGLTYQQSAEGYMRDIIMANPTMMNLYEAGRVEGYDRELHALNNGVGRDNFFFNKVNNGYLTKEEGTLKHTRFLSTRDNMTSYSTRERHDSHRTWRASDIHIQNGYDPSSITGNKLLSVEAGLEVLKNLELKSEDK